MQGSLLPPGTLKNAERELAAFLLAACQSGLNRSSEVAEVWLSELASGDFAQADFRRFFRQVTISAASKLAEKKASELIAGAA